MQCPVITPIGKSYMASQTTTYGASTSMISNLVSSQDYHPFYIGK